MPLSTSQRGARQWATVTPSGRKHTPSSFPPGSPGYHCTRSWGGRVCVLALGIVPVGTGQLTPMLCHMGPWVSVFVWFLLLTLKLPGQGGPERERDLVIYCFYIFSNIPFKNEEERRISFLPIPVILLSLLTWLNLVPLTLPFLSQLITSQSGSKWYGRINRQEVRPV